MAVGVLNVEHNLHIREEGLAIVILGKVHSSVKLDSVRSRSNLTVRGLDGIQGRVPIGYSSILVSSGSGHSLSPDSVQLDQSTGDSASGLTHNGVENMASNNVTTHVFQQTRRYKGLI